MGNILQFPGNKTKETPGTHQPPIVLEYVLPHCSNEGTHERVIHIRKQVIEIMNSSEESSDLSMRENGIMVYDVIIDTLDEPITNIDLDAVEFLLALIFCDEYSEVFPVFTEHIHGFIGTFQEYHNPKRIDTKPYDMKMADSLYEQIDDLILHSDDIVSRRWFGAVKKVLPTVNQVLYDEQVFTGIFED